MALVNENGLVLAAGDLPAIHTTDDTMNHLGHLLAHGQMLRGQILPVRHQLVSAPFVEMHRMHAMFKAPEPHHPRELFGQWLVVAKDEDGLAVNRLGLGQVLGPIAQQHGLARASHAMDDTMPLAQAARQLFLLQVHHAHDAGQFGGFIAGIVFDVEQLALHGHTDFGKHDPARAVELGQAQRLVAESVREHVPQALLKGIRFHSFGHLVGANGQVRLNGFAQAGRLELLARDAREHHAMAPGKGQLALMGTIRMHQLRITLQRVDDLNSAMPRLCQGVHHHLHRSVGDDLPYLTRGTTHRLQSPVFGFQDQQPTPWMQNDEIGVGLLWTNGDVVPEQVVVFELLFEPLGQSALAVGHARHATAHCRNQGGHDFVSICFPWDGMMHANTPNCILWVSTARSE